jgi:hypothetical protein
MTTPNTEHAPRVAPPPPLAASRPAPAWSPARLAYWFYAVAATGAVIGQTWVAVTRVPWPDVVPAVLRVLAVLPFALCLELLAMALAAMADERMRLGERAWGFRIFSGIVALVAVGILIAGHWPHYYWSAAFGTLSGSAYLLWLLHSAARRRDALRAQGKLAVTAPSYGLRRRLRHPFVTARAAELAREGQHDPATGTWRPLGMFESLRAADLAIRAEQRRPAIAEAVANVVRAGQADPLMAEIAAKTLDMDHLAAELERNVDYAAWGARLSPAITAPPLTPALTGASLDQPAPEPPVARGPAAPPAEPDSAGIIQPTFMEPPEPWNLDPTADPDDYDDEPDDGPDFEDDDTPRDLAPDLIPLLPHARHARDQLIEGGRTISRDALAAQLRGNGHPIRNNRVSELLSTLRQEDRQLNGRRVVAP